MLILKIILKYIRINYKERYHTPYDTIHHIARHTHTDARDVLTVIDA